MDVTEVAAEEEDEDLETHSTKGLIRKIYVCVCTIMYNACCVVSSKFVDLTMGLCVCC